MNSNSRITKKIQQLPEKEFWEWVEKEQEAYNKAYTRWYRYILPNIKYRDPTARYPNKKPAKEKIDSHYIPLSLYLTKEERDRLMQLREEAGSDDNLRAFLHKLVSQKILKK